jgi:uncharacterized protein (TIGR03437 family)
VNAASYSASALAPNAIATIYGTNLSFITADAEGNNMLTSGLPTSLGGVSVFIGSIAAGLFYVSPTQINFLVPADFQPWPFNLIVLRESLGGPYVPVTLNPTGPALFVDSTGNAIATHLDGTLLTASSPAIANEWVVVYAEGLGPTVPAADSYTASSKPAPIAMIGDFSLSLDERPVDATALYYVGTTPGFAGLYQINLHLPPNAGPNPQIQIAIGAQTSQANVQLPVE